MAFRCGAPQRDLQLQPLVVVRPAQRVARKAHDLGRIAIDDLRVHPVGAHHRDVEVERDPLRLAVRSSDDVAGVERDGLYEGRFHQHDLLQQHWIEIAHRVRAQHPSHRIGPAQQVPERTGVDETARLVLPVPVQHGLLVVVREAGLHEQIVGRPRHIFVEHGVGRVLVPAPRAPDLRIEGRRDEVGIFGRHRIDIAVGHFREQRVQLRDLLLHAHRFIFQNGRGDRGEVHGQGIAHVPMQVLGIYKGR